MLTSKTTESEHVECECYQSDPWSLNVKAHRTESYAKQQQAVIVMRKGKWTSGKLILHPSESHATHLTKKDLLLGVFHPATECRIFIDPSIFVCPDASLLVVLNAALTCNSCHFDSCSCI